MKGDMQTSSDELGTILRQALALSSEDQQRLALVMSRVSALEEVRPEPDPAPPPERSSADVSAWLLEISNKSPWARLELLEEALLDVGEQGDEAEALLDARRRLLDDNPPVAIRRSVANVASEHPLGTLVGVGGLILAVVGVGQAVWRIFF